MEKLTKTGLIDKCIDGDGEKLGLLFGRMFDPFSCLYTVLRESNMQQMPSTIVFVADGKDAGFSIEGDVNISADGKKKSESIFGYQVAVNNTKKSTHIKVCTGAGG